MEFSAPDFCNGSLEFRYDGGEVMIYGTSDGLKRLARLCNELSNGRSEADTDHIHLEDYELLTARSLRGTIAVLRK